MKRTVIIFYFLFLALINVFPQSEITSAELKDWIYYLASDDKKGRFPCTPESKQIADFLRQDYINNGLELLADSGFQYFQISIGAQLEGDNYFIIGRRKLKLGKDYMPFAFSDTGYFYTDKLVFVGYGFDIEEDDSVRWNDYARVDVKDKWVMILRGMPDNPPVDKKILSKYKSERIKVNTAYKHGAAGVIFINPPEDNQDKLLPFTLPRFVAMAHIPVIQLTHKRAEKILHQSLADIDKQLKKNGTYSFDVKTQIRAAVHYRIVNCKTQNVVALLPGNDTRLSGRYIIVGAHYDHLGMGGYESGSRKPDTIAVHNGADDNASGTAGVMELMEYLASIRDSLGRSIIFVNFGAEERGLLGSKYFVEHLPVPKDSIDLMINMDMIGKNKYEASFMGVGTARELPDIFHSLTLPDNTLKIKTVKQAFGGSDHASFIDAGIPAIFVYASTGEGYHTPEDDPQYINYDGEALILDYIAELIKKVADYPGKFHFVKQKDKSRGGYGGMKVRLGVRPAFDYSGKGLKVDAVVDGGVADKAGIQKGDVIVQIGNTTVENIYDYMGALSKFKPGDTTIIIVRRGGKTIEFKVKF